MKFYELKQLWAFPQFISDRSILIGQLSHSFTTSPGFLTFSGVLGQRQKPDPDPEGS